METRMDCSSRSDEDEVSEACSDSVNASFGSRLPRP